MWKPTRRELLGAGAALAVGGMLARPRPAAAYVPDNPRGERPRQAKGIEVIQPRGRVPLSFIIDDSTCLVNMGSYAMPQFAEAWPERERYKRPWKDWPREIPDAFVREFGEWCAEHGVKGKYSIVPNPACVGWLDRELPGWSRRELLDSLKLVRELMLPNWDIHPEMITHTRIIDLKTGRPVEEISSATMENSYPQEKKSVDELAAYIAYSLRILEHCDLPCEGITTPGGFGSKVKVELGLAVHQAVRSVYGTDLPHYFKYVAGGDDESTDPKVEHVRGLASDDPHAIVNVPAGTGDWYGSWDGDVPSQGDRYANADATSGRMVDLITSGRPAVMLCHWPGMYSHGTKEGFDHFKRNVTALAARFGNETLWMKVSEIARYWGAKELTAIERRETDRGARVELAAPFACPLFTLRLESRGLPTLRHDGAPIELTEVKEAHQLDADTWHREGGTVSVCFDLPRGKTTLRVEE